MGISSWWGRLSRNPEATLARVRQKLHELVQVKGGSLQIGGQAWTYYQQALEAAAKCGGAAISTVVLDFDHLFPAGPALTDQPIRDVLAILIDGEPLTHRALQAAHCLATRRADVVVIRRVEHQICLSLARRGDSNGLVAKLLDRQKWRLLTKQEIEEVVTTYLSEHTFETSPWTGFFQQLPPDQIPEIHQVHALLGRFHDAANIAEQHGDLRIALRYVLQCSGTEAARQAVTLYEERVRDPQWAVKVHQFAGEAFYQEGSYATAAEHFHKANDAARLSDCYLKVGRIADAIKLRPEIAPPWLAEVRDKTDQILREFVQRGASLEAIRLECGIAESLRDKGTDECIGTELARLEDILRALVRTARASLVEESRNAAPGAEVFRRWSALEEAAGNFLEAGIQAEYTATFSLDRVQKADFVRVQPGNQVRDQQRRRCITAPRNLHTVRHWIAVLTALPVNLTGEAEDVIEYLLQRTRYDEALVVFERLSRPFGLRQAELGLEVFARRHDRGGYDALLREHAETLGVELPDFTRLNQSVRKYAGSVVMVQCETAGVRSSGTGFVIRSREIATNLHVIAAPDGHPVIPEAVSVITSGGRRRISAIRTPGGTRDDVAILRLGEGEPELRPLRRGFSDLVELGERILTVGFPAPRDSDYQENLYCNAGLVNRITKSDLCSERVIEVSIELHGGISGAPILNEFGEVIGLLTFTLQWERVADGGHKATERSHYAIPVEILRRLWKSPWTLGFLTAARCGEPRRRSSNISGL
jgi:molecular chaperone DnaK